MTEGCFKILHQQKPRLTLTHDTANTICHLSPTKLKGKVNLQNLPVTEMF